VKARFVVPVLAVATGLLLVAGAGAILSGSTFEGNDANLVVNTAGDKDWDNAPNLSVGVDLPTGTSDNSFGNGSKEDNLNVTVGDGSIPNSKADLARFGVAGETVGNNTFLYLAWSRENQNGTVNFDFEINAAEQPNLLTNGAKTLVRTTNDLLINYGFQGGGSTAALSIRKWNGSSWGTETPISSTCSEGAANTSPVLDTLGGNPGVLRPAGQFGEAAINLVCAGVIQSGTCAPFSSAYVKSRSSTAFNSEIKDFIAPVHLNLTNCGSLTVIKRTNPRGLNQSFSYTTTGAGLAGFSLNDDDGVDSVNNTKTFSNLQAGQRTITEGADPSGFAFNNVSCTNSGGSSSSTLGRVATVNVIGGGATTCVYTNDQQLGAIKVSKTSIKGDTPLAGAVFTVEGQSNLTTGVDGTACVAGLAFGDYDVAEITAPGGYAIDNPATTVVTISDNEDCSNVTAGDTVSRSDTPLTNIDVSADSQDDGAGGTLTTIACSNDDGDVALAGSPTSNVHNPSLSVDDLEPGSYTCTLVIDP
jgi:hypothetical protein